MEADRDSFVEALGRLLQPHYRRWQGGRSPAWLELGGHVAAYERQSTELESFARPLWGLAGACTVRPHFDDWGEYITRGLTEGTNPQSPYYWGVSEGRQTQRYVEMAAIAVALILNRKSCWDALGGETQGAVARWLGTINSGEEVCGNNNWRLFRILVNSFLKTSGYAHSEEYLQLDFAAIDSYYLGAGWYADGKTEQFDHYVAFAIHFYSLLYCYLVPDDLPRCQVYRERGLAFSRDYLAWFGADGAALPFGRSLTYRFAHASFWVGYVLAGLYQEPDAPLSLSEVKGLITRNLDYWLGKPIFDTAGFLSVGYGYPNLHMSESYNAPGSPYWACKAFLILALPEADPFWAATAAPLPAKKAQLVQSAPRFLFSRDENGDVFASSGGQYARFEPRHHREKYAKFAYSSAFGFTVTVQNELGRCPIR